MDMNRLAKAILIVVGGLILTFTLLFGAARIITIDTGVSDQVMLAQFDALRCEPLPCFNNMQPGSVIGEDRRAMNGRVTFAVEQNRICPPGSPDSDSACWHYLVMPFGRNGIATITEIRVQPSFGGMRLGDLILRYGRPLRAYLCYINTYFSGDLDSEVMRPVMVGYFAFEGGVTAVAYAPDHPLRRRITTDMLIDHISFTRRPDVPMIWSGFTYQHRLGCGR